MSTITGDKALDRKLRRLAGKGASKAASAGIRASLTPVAQAMRKAVTASDASPELKRAARKTIKARFAKARFGAGKGIKQAKVGFGVGKRADAGRSGKHKGGVGVSSSNIHWFVLGTKGRRLKKGSARGPNAGHPTGHVQAVFAGLAEQALNAASGQALAKARQKIKQIIEQEATR